VGRVKKMLVAGLRSAGLLQMTRQVVQWVKAGERSGIRGMIEGFRDRWLKLFFESDRRSRQIPTDLEGRLFRKLQMIDDATRDQDLRVPPSNHFEKLRGTLDGLCSIRINKQWRLIFRWDSSLGRASDLYLDNHSYD
jgi:proteic killer suppression protein